MQLHAGPADPGTTDRLTGAVLFVTLLLVIGVEWTGASFFIHASAVSIILFLGLVSTGVGWSRRIFVIVGAVLLITALVTRDDWLLIIEAGLQTAAFIAAFFTASTCLRNAATTSPSIQKCGRFLADQQPGRRYVALTTGGHLFGLILNYGAIALLGTLAETNAKTEANVEVRNHRIRRMLLAIQRGFVSTLCWSPLTFSLAITTTLIPGSSWADALGLCLVSSLIMAGSGWAIDTIFKPRITTPRLPRAKSADGWDRLAPMLMLLGILISTVGLLQIMTGVRAVAVVMIVVPLLAFFWIAMQNTGNAPLRQAARRAAGYMEEIASYRSELVLLVMAGFIGTLGSKLLSPLVAGWGLDLAALPAWLILVTLVWLIPLTGLIGMNPILSVSLMAPLLPHANAMGVTPSTIIVALTAGWALGGASSPFTATTLLVGSIAKVSAWRVGLSWNSLYTPVCGVLLSIWVVIVSQFLS